VEELGSGGIEEWRNWGVEELRSTHKFMGTLYDQLGIQIYFLLETER
jgi:hypothetical protein